MTRIAEPTLSRMLIPIFMSVLACAVKKVGINKTVIFLLLSNNR